ncbi:putative ribonuclease H-like domain-containing protein [Tanacetum coccineum]
MDRMFLESIEKWVFNRNWPTDLRRLDVTRQENTMIYLLTYAISKGIVMSRTISFLRNYLKGLNALVCNHRIAKELGKECKLLLQGTSLTKHERNFSLDLSRLATTLNRLEISIFLGQQVGIEIVEETGGDKAVSAIGGIRETAVNPQRALKNKGIAEYQDYNGGPVAFGRHMTGNKAYLAEYQDYNGGPVAFGGSKGYITGKGKIKTGKLDFEDVCFVKELQHFNLFSVSQMCDKKNKVLFTDTECLVLSSDFKLPDENQVLLRIPRQNNMYSFNLENIVPSGGLACLIAKATVDESNKWHRRLGHVNFKNLNKLVKGNLVRGLPSKIFQNDHTCVACQKGKQHKASCKAKIVSSISQPLQLLHMDLFGPTSVRSINHKTYCLVITDDFSRFSWVFFLRTKDETSGILKDFIRQIENQLNQKVKTIRCDNGTEFKNRDIIEFCGSKGIKREYSNARTPQQNRVAERKNMTLIEAARTMLADLFLPNTFWAEAVSTACYVLNRVLVTKPQNKTPYELITGKIPIISYIRPFGCHVTILNTIDHLGKFEGKSDEGFLVGYSLNSKAFRNQANKTAGPEEANHSAGTQDNIDAGNSEMEADPAQDYFVLPICSSYTSTVKSSEAKNEGEKPNKDTGLKTNEEPVDQEDQAFLEELERLKRQEKEANDAAEVLRKEFAQSTEDLLLQAGAARATSTNTVNTVRTPVSTASSSGGPSYPNLTNYADQDDSQIPALEDIYGNSNDGIFTNASYDDEGAVADFTNLESTVNVSPIPTSRIHSIHPTTQILGNSKSAVQTRSKVNKSSRAHAFKISKALEDKSWVDAMQEELLQFKIQKDRKPLTNFLALCLLYGVQSLSMGCENCLPVLVQKIVGILKGKPKLGLWYPRVSPFDLEAYSDSDYAGTNLDRKSTTGGCQFLGRRLISWQCKKQTIVATSITEAEYVAAASCCGQVLHHFIRDAFEKKLIQVLKIHTDDNVADLLTKAFDAGRNITAKVAGKPVTISEASIRSSLLFDDADGIDSLNNQAIFDAIQQMGHLDAKKKFVMYPRFISILLDTQLKDVPVPVDHFPVHALTSKVFSLMVKKGKHFLGKVTPLFPTMLVQSTEDEGEGLDKPSAPQPTPSPTNTSKAQVELQPDPSPQPIPSPSHQTGKKVVKSSKGEPSAHKDPAFDLIDDAMEYQETERGKDKESTDLHQAKAVSREKEKGVELKDVKNIKRPRPTSIRSILTLNPLPKIDPKDKGKKRIEEEESDTASDDINETKKKFKMLAHDEEIARKMQEEWEVEEEKNILAVEEATKCCSYTRLRESGKKHADLKNRNFDDIQALYDRIKRNNDKFLTVDSTKDKRKKKEMNEKAKDPGLKRLKKKVVQETPKEEETVKVPTELEVTKQHRKCLRVVAVDSVIDSEVMESKSIIMGLNKVSSPDGDYLVIYRANGSFRAFNYLLEVLHIFDKQDVLHLYNLVMEQYSEITLDGYELILWGDLKIMMESLIEENDQMCILELQDGIIMHMLVKRRYPLSKEVLQSMIDLGLDVQKESTATLDLISKELASPGSNSSRNMSSNTPDYIYPIIILSNVDVEDAFSFTHSPDYIPGSPDYFPASSGNTSPDSSDDLSKYPHQFPNITPSSN